MFTAALRFPCSRLVSCSLCVSYVPDDAPAVSFMDGCFCHTSCLACAFCSVSGNWVPEHCSGTQVQEHRRGSQTQAAPFAQPSLYQRLSLNREEWCVSARLEGDWYAFTWEHRACTKVASNSCSMSSCKCILSRWLPKLWGGLQTCCRPPQDRDNWAPEAWHCCRGQQVQAYQVWVISKSNACCELHVDEYILYNYHIEGLWTLRQGTCLLFCLWTQWKHNEYGFKTVRVSHVSFLFW